MTSKQGERPRVQIIACDAGGTMTDAISVDEAGRFSIGKASTTPEDQSIGYIAVSYTHLTLPTSDLV